jgi:hypothetical protein
MTRHLLAFLSWSYVRYDRTTTLMSRTSRILVGLSWAQHTREVLPRSYRGGCLSSSGAEWSTRQGEWAISRPWQEMAHDLRWVLHECSTRARVSSRMKDKWYWSKTMMTTGHGGWSSFRIYLLVYEYFLCWAEKIIGNHPRSQEDSQ